MADNKNKMDARDRSKVGGDQDYEVRHFAEANGIDIDVARRLIKKFGNDREALEAEAKRLRA